MNRLNDVVQFYKECYLNDFKAISIKNFFSKTVQYPLVLNSFEPLVEKIPSFPIDSDWAKEVESYLEIHSKEKQLYAGFLFLKGKKSELGKLTTVFAPLFIYKAELIISENYYSIELDVNSPILNPEFLELVNSENVGEKLTYDEFDKMLPKGHFDFENLISLKNTLLNLFPLLDISCLEKNILSHHLDLDLVRLSKSKSEANNRKLIDGFALGIINKTKSSRGVVNELNEIANKELDSNVFEDIFNSQNKSIAKPKARLIQIPVNLSESQKEVFYSVDNCSTTLVFGPPGTGKSFTIAALASELISNGKSVLIASRSSQAGKVISNKIELDFGLSGLLVKATTKNYKRSLVSRINVVTDGFSKKAWTKDKLKSTLSEITSLQKQIYKHIEILENRKEDELKWGQFYFDFKGGFLGNLKDKWIRYRKKSNQSITLIKKQISLLEEAKHKLQKKYIVNQYRFFLNESLNSHRNEFINLRDALNFESGNLIHQTFDKIDFSLVLKALPGWVCNTGEIQNILPLKKELFDVLIIDEATQCDIASVIPLLYRAKKVVIVGDPKQLRHISFLSKQKQAELQKKYGLSSTISNYRSHSILDLVNQSLRSQHQLIFLSEHFRSNPKIIDFSNRHFYNNGLQVMTNSPLAWEKQSLQILKSTGQRAKSGENEVEANLIIQKITTLIKNNQKYHSKHQPSIGVISPFRAQVSLIKRLLKDSIDYNEIKKYQILVGTPFHFQGEERDIIFLSFTLNNDSHGAAFRYLNKPDVFNVSITRAKQEQWVVTSLNYNELNPDYLVTKYLANINDGFKPKLDSEFVYDRFADEVVNLLKQSNAHRVIQGYNIGSLIIDIMVIYRDKTYCIDLIGYPGAFVDQYSSSTMNMVERMGFELYFISYSDWYLDEKKCKTELFKFIGIK